MDRRTWHALLVVLRLPFISGSITSPDQDMRRFFELKPPSLAIAATICVQTFIRGTQHEPGRWHADLSTHALPRFGPVFALLKLADFIERNV